MKFTEMRKLNEAVFVANCNSLDPNGFTSVADPEPEDKYSTINKWLEQKGLVSKKPLNESNEQMFKKILEQTKLKEFEIKKRNDPDYEKEHPELSKRFGNRPNVGTMKRHEQDNKDWDESVFGPFDNAQVDVDFDDDEIESIRKIIEENLEEGEKIKDFQVDSNTLGAGDDDETRPTKNIVSVYVLPKESKGERKLPSKDGTPFRTVKPGEGLHFFFAKTAGKDGACYSLKWSCSGQERGYRQKNWRSLSDEKYDYDTMFERLGVKDALEAMRKIHY